MNIGLTSLLIASVSALCYAAPIVHPGVHRALRQNAAVNIAVEFGSTSAVLESLEESTFATAADKTSAMVANLQKHQAEATTELDALVTSESGASEPQFQKVKKVWIANRVFVEGASAEFVEKLSGLSNVVSIREEKVLQVPTPIMEAGNTTTSLIGHEWGVAKIQAPEVWKDGTFGDDVVVGIIDTGVRYTHEAIKSKFRSDYGWFDPEKQEPLPYDFLGHGTHVTGTIVGGNGIGVAPNAQFIMCKGCREGGCTESDLLACAQFITCPTTTEGDEPDCSKAPRVVSNSWGGGQEEMWYADAVAAWHEAGIIPIFAQGNKGPNCKTAQSPGDYENVIGVGSTTMDDALSRTSSKGPTAITKRQKPDISAPGSKIRSAWIGADNEYRVISGTSMATPHVSGAVALLLSRNPSLTYDQVKTLLLENADRKGLKNTNHICGGVPDSVWPNNQWGSGRMNIFKSYAAMEQ